MFRIYKEKNSLIAARRNGKWRLVFAEIAAFKGVEIIYLFAGAEREETAFAVEEEKVIPEEKAEERVEEKAEPKKAKAKKEKAEKKEKVEEVVVEPAVEEVKAEEKAEAPAAVVEEKEEPIEEEKVEEVAEEKVEETAETEEEVEQAAETEETEEVPLENSAEEEEITLKEEGSLEGSEEEVEILAAEETEKNEEVVEEKVEEPAAVEEVVEEKVEEPAAVEEVVEEKVEEPVAEEPVAEEVKAEEPVAEEIVEEATEEIAEEEQGEEEAEEEKEEKALEKKEAFKLTVPENLGEIMPKICAKRARKLIYRPNEELFSMTCEVLGTDKNNEEKISVKKILEAEIKEGLKLGYLDKFDGLKGSELKEEYENDTVYEYAEQEFKRTGLLYDGKKVKVYVFDWDLKACHHIGYIADEFAEKVLPYMLDSEKYSFDVNGIITGGKYKKIIKDPATGKITVEKGNDGNLGVEIDVTVINRKD